MRSRLVVLVGLIGLFSAPLAARVDVRTGKDGRLHVTNEGSVGSVGWEHSGGAAGPVRRGEALHETIVAASQRHDLDPDLVRAVIQAESAWKERAVSRKGAMGLMQIMPATARELSLERPFEAAENVRAGTAYLRRMIDRFDGDVVLALAAYNAGPRTVARYGGVPPYPETVSYVRRVLRLWRGGAAPRVVPAVRARSMPREAPPSRPVRWREAGGRPHLTNVQ